MSEPPIRRSNWTPTTPPTTGSHAPPPAKDDPFAELERIVRREVAQQQQKQAQTAFPPHTQPRQQTQASEDAFFGINEADFEAAFRSLDSAPPPPPKPRDPLSRDAIYGAQAAPPPPPQPAAPLKRQEFEYRADAFDYDARASGTYSAEASTQDQDLIPETYMMERRGRSGMVTVGAIVGLLVVGLLGATIYSWLGGGSTDEPVIIKADNNPTKVKPDLNSDQQPSKMIYDRLGNDQSQSTSAEKVVPREEQPVADLTRPSAETASPVANPAPVATTAPQVTASEPAAATQPAPQTNQVSRVILPAPNASTGLGEPKRVATTTIRVKPDGTLESAPTQPVVTQAPKPAPVELKPATVAPQAAPTQVTPAQVMPQVPAAATAETAPLNITPEEQSPSLPPATAPQTQRVAQAPVATQPVPQAPAAQVRRSSPTFAAGTFVVQISSQKEEGAAYQSFDQVQRRFPQVLAGYQPQVKAVDLGARGTFYRVRVGPMQTRDEAAELCSRLKSAGGDCVVTPN